MNPAGPLRKTVHEARAQINDALAELAAYRAAL